MTCHRAPGWRSRIAASARRGLDAMHRRDWLIAACVIIAVTALAGAMLVAQVAAFRTTQQATVQAQLQRDQAIDTREAQSRRIDQLSEQVSGLRDVVEGQARTIGRQEQAIRDLAAQVQSSGQTPVVTSVAPRRDTPRTPAPKRGSKPTSPSAAKPTTAPTSTPRPTKAPTPHQDDPGLLCGLLPLIC